MMKNSKAFTLVELLLVVSIISILAVIALPNFEDAQVRTKVSAIKNNLRVVAQKLEMHHVDTNDYPRVAKWRQFIMWQASKDKSLSYEQKRAKAMKDVADMYGPHQDMFDMTWLKENVKFSDSKTPLNDVEWFGSANNTYLFNGFMYLYPRHLLSALEAGVDWDGGHVCLWGGMHHFSGEWILYSCGPDLTVESPTNMGTEGEAISIAETGYDEHHKLFIDYDPTNGTTSYGNIFRTQKNPAGFGAEAAFLRLLDEDLASSD